MLLGVTVLKACPVLHSVTKLCTCTSPNINIKFRAVIKF